MFQQWTCPTRMVVGLRDGDSWIPTALHGAKSDRARRCQSQDLPVAGSWHSTVFVGGFGADSPGAGAGYGGVQLVPWGHGQVSVPNIHPCPSQRLWLSQLLGSSLQPWHLPAPRHLTPARHMVPLSPCHLSPGTSCSGTSVASPAPVLSSTLCTAFPWGLAALLGHGRCFGGL